VELLKQTACTICRACFLEKTPSGGLTQARRKAKGQGDLATILTPDVPLTPIPTGVAGPLPEDIVRFVLGRSSLSFQKKKKRERKEISVVHGVVDSDYIEKLKSWYHRLPKLYKLIKVKE